MNLVRQLISIPMQMFRASSGQTKGRRAQRTKARMRPPRRG